MYGLYLKVYLSLKGYGLHLKVYIYLKVYGLYLKVYLPLKGYGLYLKVYISLKGYGWVGFDNSVYEGKARHMFSSIGVSSYDDRVASDVGCVPQVCTSSVYRKA